MRLGICELNSLVTDTLHDVRRWKPRVSCVLSNIASDRRPHYLGTSNHNTRTRRSQLGNNISHGKGLELDTTLQGKQSTGSPDEPSEWSLSLCSRTYLSLH
jgi:hypothetical protein